MSARTLGAFILAWLCAAANATPAVNGPDKGTTGGEITVTATGSTNPRDFLSIVPKGSKVGTYGNYQYVENGVPKKLKAPSDPGDYEIRLLAADSPYPTLASRSIRIEGVSASLDGPTSVAAGVKFDVRWTGPGNDLDYIAIGDAQRPYIVYAYVKAGNPVNLMAPDKAGDYELRYFLGQGDKVIATRKLTIGSVSASVTAPATVAAGAVFKVTWTGPGNALDFVTIVNASEAEGRYGPYAHTRKGATLELTAPDQPGSYEVRYLTGQTYATLGRAKVAVTANTASLQAPAEAVGGSTFAVTWKGPNNALDYITIVAPTAAEGTWGSYAYTSKGNPSRLLAPLKAGAYEVRYATGQSHVTLARAPIRIMPAKAEPGLVAVTAVPVFGSVEIVLDASGSMLQRIGAQRRIDLAKQTLTRIISTIIPANTPFALRVLGREVDSCQTDLDIPLAPLNASAVTARIARLDSKNNARTPLGASLEKVLEDLGAARGDRLVILLTDGDETCGGNPGAAMAKLTAAGIRVNIVGFAIDDPKLAGALRHWSDTAGGHYFEAKDAASLDRAMTQATRAGFSILDADNRVVAKGTAGGEAVSVLPGNYTVHLSGSARRTQPATVKSKETAYVKFD
ncbi:MAG: VWA domain-containing protein [Gammaproteobacteria bacterium]|nr:VWA domain-containing protein [Gammaproteobacteria bacterium]